MALKYMGFVYGENDGRVSWMGRGGEKYLVTFSFYVEIYIFAAALVMQALGFA